MMQTALFESLGLRFTPEERRGAWLRLACALVWALELFWLQKLSFAAVLLAGAAGPREGLPVD